MHSNDILLGSMYVTLLAFYVPLLFFIRAKSNLRRAERAFYRGMVSIFENSTDVEDPISEVAILYKRLSESYTEITKKFRSPAELIEELIVGIDTLDEKVFRERYRMDRPLQFRSKLYGVLTQIRERSPFASLSSKEANLMSTLATALDSSNKELGKNIIRQLADELEISGANLRSQNQKNHISFIVSVVSVVLTVFFGIVSIVPLLKG